MINFVLEGTVIDRVILDPAWFRLMALLYIIDSADFIFLMQQTSMTRGNLYSHMTKLEAAGHLEIE
ncbi:MAG: transcriptional regulator [Anaerolineales bacterium]|nr:transcriptional regulator [Anaerolineales bacterium]